MRRAVLSLALALSASCTWGGTPWGFRPALGPDGARVTMRVRGEAGKRIGELIAVDSVGVTIRQDRLVRVAWARVVALDIDQVGDDYDVSRGEQVTPAKRARIALLARFPQGIEHLPIHLDSLIDETARDTKRFADRRVAVEAGYRRIGADFPGMGEHWLNTGVLLEGRIDPSQPTILVYADIRGVPTLLGVGFAAITRGDTMPHDLPGWPAHWHEHSGLLEDESGVRPSRMAGGDGTHVWVMHAWTELENPQGEFEPDNWALPYRRAGRPVAAELDPSAARALALTVGGDEFLRGLLSDAGLRTPASAGIVDSTILRARQRAIVAGDDAALGATWRDLRDGLVKALGPYVVPLLEPSHHAGHG